MTCKEAYERVREACIDANPDIVLCSVCRQKYTDNCFMDHTGQCVSRPIRLTDVLIAIQNVKKVDPHCIEAMEAWDWKRDSLVEQTDPVIFKIASLLQ